MALIIEDLRIRKELDGKAMSRIRGARGPGGASWLYGWVRPYVETSQHGGASVVNFFQTNNIYIADQINQQVAEISVDNSAANAVINIDAKQQSMNLKVA